MTVVDNQVKTPTCRSRWAQVGDFIETDMGPGYAKARVRIADEYQCKYVDGLIGSGHWERKGGGVIGIVEEKIGK